MQLWDRPLLHPVRNLVGLVVGWKILLLVLAAFSPGPGYDTSTSLALTSHDGHRRLPWLVRYFVEKLTRWDGIYFVTISRRGYLHEQEWAFGWGFTRLISLCTYGLTIIGVPHYEGLEACVAISISHLAHLFSVVLLFKLTLALFGRSFKKIAFTSAALQILSPAGLFLSAPCAESCCAFLTLSGCLNFAKSLTKDGKSTLKHDLLVVMSGIMFGAATTFRSNGILSGLLLLEEAFRILFLLRYGLHVSTLRRLVATGIGGLFVGAGFFLPQYVAYNEYCNNPDWLRRPWCENKIPSIYTFVQDYYWNVGLFRYWTASNIPLFLLAAPMFVILTKSGLWALKLGPKQILIAKKPSGNTEITEDSVNPEGWRIVRNLGLSQLLLVAITLTTAHVQIITRISSAYPVWLWYFSVPTRKEKPNGIGVIVQFVVMYGVIQGGLYASFLPPA